MKYIGVRSVRIEYERRKYLTLVKSGDWTIGYYLGDNDLGETLYCPSFEMDGDEKHVYTNYERTKVFHQLVIDHFTKLGIFNSEMWENEYNYKRFIQILDMVM